MLQQLIKSKRTIPLEKFLKIDQKEFIAKAAICYPQSRYLLVYLFDKGLLKKWYDATPPHIRMTPLDRHPSKRCWARNSPRSRRIGKPGCSRSRPPRPAFLQTTRTLGIQVRPCPMACGSTPSSKAQGPTRPASSRGCADQDRRHSHDRRLSPRAPRQPEERRRQPARRASPRRRAPASHRHAWENAPAGAGLQARRSTMHANQHQARNYDARDHKAAKHDAGKLAAGRVTIGIRLRSRTTPGCQPLPACHCGRCLRR